MANELWRFFVEGVPDVLLQLTADGTILYANRTFPGMLSGDIRGTTIYDHLQPAGRPLVRQALADVCERAEMRYMDMPVVLEDGTVRWYSASAGPVIFGERVVAITMVARDMTDQRNAEIALRESEARYRTLVEHAPEAIVVLDVDARRFVDANANACALFGLSMVDLLQREPVGLSPVTQPDGRRSDAAARDYIDLALAGETPTFQWTHLGVGGLPVPCEVRLVRLPPLNRRLVRGSIIDVTAQRRLEGQIAQFQKLDTLGHVAAGIVHDFNNILTIVDTSVELLLGTLPEESESRQHALDIRGAVRRAAQLTQHLLVVARHREPVTQAVDLNAAIEHVVEVLGRLLGPDVHIEQRLVPGGAVVAADDAGIDQILTNLLLNARDAMPEGGRIVIETAPSPGETAFILRVTDEGTGIEEAKLARIFEPLFTTKPPGQGTGLGLSTTAMIVRKYGGRIAVASTLGEGSTFEIVLPAPST